MRVLSLRYSPGQHRKQKHWHGWNQFGTTGASPSVPKYDWCAPLSHPSFCMLVNHGPSQKSSKREYKPWKWGATAKTTYLIQRPLYQPGSPCKDPAGNQTTWRPPDHGKKMQTAVVWSCLPFIRSGKNHLARHSERGKKTRQTEEEVVTQHQGLDRAGIRQVQEGSWEQGKMEETVKSSVVPQRPSQLRDWWDKIPVRYAKFINLTKTLFND